MNYWEMLKAISPFDYTKRNKFTNHTDIEVELIDEREVENNGEKD